MMKPKTKTIKLDGVTYNLGQYSFEADLEIEAAGSSVTLDQDELARIVAEAQRGMPPKDMAKKLSTCVRLSGNLKQRNILMVLYSLEAVREAGLEPWDRRDGAQGAVLPLSEKTVGSLPRTHGRALLEAARALNNLSEDEAKNS